MFDDQEDPMAQLGAPQPEVSQPQATPDFSDLFEQQVMQQMRDNSPEEIRKRKIQEYFGNMGVKPDTKRGKMAQIFKEMSNAYTARQNKKEYKPLNDRVTDESRAEYEKMLPGIRGEANTLYANKRYEEANKSREKVAQIKADADKYEADTKASYLRVKALSDAGLAQFKGQKIKMETELLKKAHEDLEKLDPNFKLYTPEMKNAVAMKHLRDKGYDMDTVKSDISDVANAKAAPSEQKAQMTDSDDMFSKYMSREDQLNRSKEQFKKPRSSGGGGNMRIVMMNKTNPDGSIQQVPTFIDPKNPQGGATEISSSDPNLKPNDQRIRAIAERFKSSHTQARAAMGEITSSIEDGRDKDFIGPASANPITKNLRLMGFAGDKSAPESLSDALLSNAIAMHVQGMMGGGSRYAFEALKEFKNRIASEHTASPKSLMSGMGALNYSIEIGLLENAGKVKDSDVDNILMALINKEIEGAISKAYSNRVLRKKSSISLRPLEELIKDADKMRGGSVLSDEEKLRRDFNIPKRN